MPTELNYVDGKWLDRDEELLLRRAELLAEKKNSAAATKNDFAARIDSVPSPPSSSELLAPKSPAVICSQVSPDLMSAADVLLCLGGAGSKPAADVTPLEMDEKSSTDAAASKNDTKKRQLSPNETEAGDANPPSEKKRRKYYVKLCKVENCTKLVQKGGVCIGHGARLKRCSSEGCPNRAVKGGVCKRHGAVVVRKKCIVEDCTSLAVKGGVCFKHGARRPVKAAVGGIENNNSAKKPTPANKKGGKGKVSKLCKPVTSRGSPRCSYEGCPRYAQRGGVCITHGAVFIRKRCKVEGCENGVKKRGLCRRHGAYAEDTPPK